MRSSPEKAAGDDCTTMHRRFAGSDWTRDLPLHISAMLGNNEWGVPIWRRRAMPPDGKIFELESFEDYLMRPFRDGLGLKSWWAIDCALKTQGEVGREAIAMIEQEIGREKYRDNVNLSRLEIVSQGKASLTFGEAGTKGGRGHKASAASRGFSTRSTVGIVARLKRDHPDIAKRLARGEFKSARAAAREAGIKIDLTPLQQLRRYWKTASEEERAAFREEICD